MGLPIVKYRLSDEPRDFGLSCGAHGLTLAGVPLLKRTEAGFQPRPLEEIGRLIGRAYQTDADIAGLMGGLNAVARALNGGEQTRAMVAALLLKLPDLDWDGAARIALADEALSKAGFNPDEGRDSQGRWTTDGALVGSPANDHLRAPGRNRDRLPLLPPQDSAEDADLLEIADNSKFHNEIQQGLADDLRAHGLIAETEVNLTFVGSDITARADIVAMVPGNPTSLTLIEIKTGPRSRLENDQVWVYPGFVHGDIVASSDAKIASFGFSPGQPLPVGRAYIWYERHPDTPRFIFPIEPIFPFLWNAPP